MKLRAAIGLLAKLAACWISIFQVGSRTKCSMIIGYRGTIKSACLGIVFFHPFAHDMPVLLSILFVLGFCVVSFAYPKEMIGWLQMTTDWVFDQFAYYYLYLGFLVVLITVGIAISPYGKIRLGKATDTVEYSLWAWLSMLYSTGMGAGLLLRAVQEPVYYFVHPPIKIDYAQQHLALQYTFFHWGLTPWAFYGLFGLIISYFLYNLDRSILSSSILEGKLKHKITEVGMDGIVIMSTILGVVAAVGLGSKQIVGGMHYLFGWADSIGVLIGIILIISTLATISAFSGLSKGIQLISKWNIGMTLVLLFFALIYGHVPTLLRDFGISLYHYLQDFALMSLNLGKFKASNTFLKDWTCFYWAFWLAWTPFTGVFIARISRGRTLRGFLLGTLLVPSFGTFVWFTVFGSAAFAQIGDAAAYQGQFDSIYSAIFLFFKALGVGSLASYLTTLLVFTFLITSIDSAIFVLSMFSDSGNAAPHPRYRVLWGILLGMLTIAVVWLGQDSLLNSISQLMIVFALPFSFIYLLMIFSLFNKLWRHPNQQRPEAMK